LDGLEGVHYDTGEVMPYANIVFEITATLYGNAVRAFLDLNPDIKRKLHQGEMLTAEEVERIKKGTKPRVGYSFVEGFLVFVPPAK
jgi:hypothetical protein